MQEKTTEHCGLNASFSKNTLQANLGTVSEELRDEKNIKNFNSTLAKALEKKGFSLSYTAEASFNLVKDSITLTANNYIQIPRFNIKVDANHRVNKKLCNMYKEFVDNKSQDIVIDDELISYLILPEKTLSKQLLKQLSSAFINTNISTKAMIVGMSAVVGLAAMLMLYYNNQQQDGRSI